MTDKVSLDDLISKKAEEFADQVKEAARIADKEEEIRIEVEIQLAFIQKETGIKLEGKHEYTIASGRTDSFYKRVIIEYKNPNSPACIGPNSESPGSKKVIEQIKKRFYDLRSEHGHEMKTLFGVGLDGKRFIFIRYVDDKWQVQEPVEVNKYTAERFLWALFNLGQKGKAFSPEYLTGDFGADAPIAQDGIKILYQTILKTKNPKAETFFNQWKILFSEVCGYDLNDPHEKMKKLADSYNINTSKLKPAELLFAVHTYYALFMKLLAAQIVSYFHKLPPPLEKMQTIGSSEMLKRELADLEQGGIFRHLNIVNFLEGDLFAWYLEEWTGDIEQIIRKMVAKLDDYNPGTLSEDPITSRDLLKKLYHQLFPKSVRHDLGEYYTPDWLAEFVLDELGYIGDPDKRLLDPACGSGTFLVMAIGKIKQWFDENREKCRFDERELSQKILSNVIGFDLNPLAVMAARTNYLIAFRNLITYSGRVEIPVYLCDSIMTPSEHGGLFAGDLGQTRELKTVAAEFIIPTEIATNPTDVAKYADCLEFCVKNEYSPDEFLQRCTDEGLVLSLKTIHVNLFNTLVELDKANKNGVWARIIKNAFAPLFIGKVDYIAGNPPWVFWNNLPSEYRLQLRKIMGETYGLIKLKASKMGKLGQTGKDISMAFVYVALDQYLVMDGKLGFVITQTIFQSTAGAEFRRFVLPDKTYFDVKRVHDMVSVNPFSTASNRTAIILANKGQATKYPIEYYVWTPVKSINVDDSSLHEVVSSCNIDKSWARPSATNQTSPWSIAKQKTKEPLGSLSDSSLASIKARKGLQTGAEGIYRIQLLRKIGENEYLVRNDIRRSKRKVSSKEGVVSNDFIYPFTAGSSTVRWKCSALGYYLIPHTPNTGMFPVLEEDMKIHNSSTYSFLNSFKNILENRAIHKQWGAGHPFYSVYNIGPYTFAQWKVAWKRVSSTFAAAVVSNIDDPYLGYKLLIPNESMMIIACPSSQEAYFICGLLNSSIARWQIERSVTMQMHSEIMNVVAIPVFDKSDEKHKLVTSISLKLHTAAGESNNLLIEEYEQSIDEAAAELWGITCKELQNIQNSMKNTHKTKQK